MYSDPENLAREWLIHDVTKPVQDWYHHQCLQLRGVQKSFDWAASQCQGSYWNNILAVLKVLDGNSHFCRWGIILHVDEDRLLICILTERHQHTTTTTTKNTTPLHQSRFFNRVVVVVVVVVFAPFRDGAPRRENPPSNCVLPDTGRTTHPSQC